MTAATIAIVGIGVLAAVALAVTAGIDATTVILLLLIAGVGGLAIAAARRMKAGSVAPGRCSECGGLMSATSPYCSHCGARSS